MCRYFHCIVSVVIGQRDVWYRPDSSYGQSCSRCRECSSLLHLSKSRHKLLHDVRQIPPTKYHITVYVSKQSASFFIKSFSHSGCDNCNEWFHGHCINVTEKMAKVIREWYCQKCQGQWLKTFTSKYLNMHLNIICCVREYVLIHSKIFFIS